MKYFYLFILANFVLTPINSQAYQLEWGKIPRLDLVSKQYPTDTLAEAAVLGEIGKFYFRNGDEGYEYQLSVHRRIKLFHKQSFDRHAVINIPFYHQNDSEYIRNIEAQTINPDGHIFTLDRKDFFVERENEYWTTINFTFPHLEEGSIIEFRYDLHSQEIIHPRSWFFQGELPVRFSQLSIHNFSFLSFVTLFEGAEYMDLLSKDKDEIRLHRGDMRFLFSDEFYLMENAPALKTEAYMTNIDDYRVRLRLQLSEINRSDGSKQPFLSSWSQSAKDLIGSSFFGGRFLQKKAYKKIDQILRQAEDLSGSPEAKMRKIYHFLLRRVEWDGTNGIQPKRNLYEAFQTAKASTAELNFMLLALLNAHHIEAHPVLISTRDNGQMTQKYPLIDQFNYVMAIVNIGGKTWLLDATHPLRPPGMPGINTLNKKAWIVNPEMPQWINLEVPICKDRFRADIYLNENGQVKGTLEATYNSYSAFQERRFQQDDPFGHYWLRRLQFFHPDASIDSISFDNVEQLEAKFINNISFKVSTIGKTYQDYLYLSPTIYANFSENPFKQAYRNFPVDFPYPFAEERNIVLHLPPNYDIIELPESLNYHLPNDQAFISYACIKDDNRILISCRLSIQQDLITPTDYPMLKQLFDYYVQLLNTQIVLKKK